MVEYSVLFPGVMDSATLCLIVLGFFVVALPVSLWLIWIGKVTNT